MRKLTIAGLAIALALALNLVTPPPADAAALKEWRRVTNGFATDISIGPTGDIMAIGNAPGQPVKIYNWTIRREFAVRLDDAKRGTRIDIGPNQISKSMPWIVGGDKFVYTLLGGLGWQKVGTLSAIDVGVGADGTAWAVGTDGSPYKLSGATWQKQPGSGIRRIDVGPKGHPWTVNDQGQVSTLTTKEWVDVGTIPANDISVSADNVVMIAAKGGGTAFFKRLVWEKDGPNVESVNAALGPANLPPSDYHSGGTLGFPLVSTATQQVWNRPPPLGVTPTGSIAGDGVTVVATRNNKCQVCFYSGWHYTGKEICTQGRVNDLHKVKVKDVIKKVSGVTFNFADLISSVRVQKSGCPSAYVTLFEGVNGAGKKLTLLNSEPELTRRNWDNKVSSVEFLPNDGSKCEVCIYKDAGYKGGAYCTRSSVWDLRALGWSNKASSIKFDKKSCPKGLVSIYEGKDFEGKSIAVDSNYSNLGTLRGGFGGGREKWDNVATSLFLSKTGRNHATTLQPLKCRACLEGEEKTCVDPGQQITTLGGVRIASLELEAKDCPMGKSLVATLYEKENFKGQRVVAESSYPRLNGFYMGNGWGDHLWHNTGSMRVKLVDKASFNCRVCLYEEKVKRFSGGMRLEKRKRVCVNAQQGVANFDNVDWAFGFNDKATVIEFKTKSCPKGTSLVATLYEDKKFKGERLQLDGNDPAFIRMSRGKKKNWSSAVSSVQVSLVNNAYLNCRACLYEANNYGGKKYCTSSSPGRLKDFSFNDIGSSIKFQTTGCPKGKSLVVTLYEKDKYKGKVLQLEGNAPSLSSVRRGKKDHWNDVISSLKVKLISKAQQNCRVCLYEAFNYGGKKYCTSSGIKHLKDVSFNDVTSSYKVFRKSCLGAGVTFFEHGNWGGNRLEYRLGNDNVGSLNRSWNDKITGVLFNPTKSRVVDSSLPKPAGRNRWFATDLEALDISAGPDGLVWIIGTDNNPKIWDGKRWSKRGSQKGTRIDAGPHGTAWMVGTDKFLYTWKDNAWKKVGFRKATDVGVGPGGTVWIVSGDNSDKGYGGGRNDRNKPAHYKIYRWNGSRWIKGDQYAMRIDVDPRGHAWIVTRDRNGPYSYTRFVPRAPVSGPRPPEYGGRTQWDVSIGAKGKVVVAADAPWVLKGRKWDVDHGRYFSAISVDRNGDLWGISTWDSRNNRPNKGVKKKIHVYVNALKNVVKAPAAAAPRATEKKWRRTAGKALDISAGPEGYVWAIGADNRPLIWNGTGWDKRGSIKGTRIDAGPHGTAWMVGQDKYPYSWTGTAWKREGNKTVSDVGVGADGTVWAVGTNPNTGLKWTGSNWRRRPVNGTVLRIDVGPKGRAWAVTQRGKVLARSENRGVWTEAIYLAPPRSRQRPPPAVPANDISIGADGTVMIAAKEGGGAVWDAKKYEWMKRSLPRPDVTSIAVNQNGVPWVSTAKQEIWAIRDVLKAKPPAKPKAVVKKWRAFPGAARDISAGPGGSLWVIGPTGTPWTFTGGGMAAQIRARQAPDALRKMMYTVGWMERPGPASTRIDVGPKGWVWIIGTDGYAYHWRSNKWNKIGGKTVSDIAIGANGHAWAIGTDRKAGGHSIYRFTGKWTVKGGAAVRIDVGPKGNPWVVNDKGQVFLWNGKGWVDTAAIAMAAARNAGPYAPKFPPRLPANDISVGAKGKVWIAVKGGGTAVWTGFGWAPGGLNAKPANVAVDKNDVPWATTDKQEIWAVR